MISSIRLRNFKRFRESAFELNALTVLTGVNCAGKSTVLQALNRAHKASQLPGHRSKVDVCFDSLSVGEAYELVHRDTDDQKIEISLRNSEGENFPFAFQVHEDRALWLDLVDRPQVQLEQFSGDDSRFVYLSAERQGPRRTQKISGGVNQLLRIGTRGEYSAHLLAQFQRAQVSEGRCREGAVSSGVKHQLEGWLSHLVGPTQVDAQWPLGLDVALLRFKDPSHDSSWVAAPNTGFGLSYSLPIVLAGLLIPKGGLFLIENPEAHLHPAGQSRIGQFLANIAADGVQVIVETHSDHVINGIRRAVCDSATPGRSIDSLLSSRVRPSGVRVYQGSGNRFTLGLAIGVLRPA